MNIFIEADPRVAFRVNPEQPKRVLVWGASYQKNNLRLKEGIEMLRLEKKRVLVFVISFGCSTIAKDASLNIHAYQNFDFAEAIVKSSNPDVVFIEDAQLLSGLEVFLDFLDTLNLTVFLSAVSTQDTGTPYTAVAEIFHTCRFHPVATDCDTCGGKEGFFNRIDQSNTWLGSANVERSSSITNCVSCFKKGYTGFSGLDDIETDSPTEFAQEMLNLMNGNEAILTCSEEDDSELDDEFKDLSVYEKKRMGFI